jgi:nitrogenase molybdenum-iron protein NifN
MDRSPANIEFGRTLSDKESGGLTLKKKFSINNHRLGMPIGIEETDRFFELLSTLSDLPVPEKYRKERGRLVDTYLRRWQNLWNLICWRGIPRDILWPVNSIFR